MSKKIFTTIAVVLVLSIVFYFNFSFFKKEYLIFFKQSGVIFYRNRRNEFSGVQFTYVNGKVESKTTFLDGLKEGPAVLYYEDGNVKHRLYFRNDLAEGDDFGYYENGNLECQGYVKKGKRFGNFYWYYENGKLKKYYCFDINGSYFYYNEENKSGKVTYVEGFLICPTIFSLKNNGDVEILSFNLDKNNGYGNIRDLYIVVATPPGLDLKIEAQINDKLFKNLTIKNNVIKIPDVFIEKGIYKILIKNVTQVDPNLIYVYGHSWSNIARTIKVD